MASESVKILIEADDKASAQIAAASKKVEQNIKNIKDAGQKTKASTEFFGVVATFSGGSQFGALAGQIAALTEKTSQFAEVSKLGGAGAAAFKAGLLGMAGVMSFQVGKAFGDILWQTDKWNRLLDESRAKAETLGQRQLQLMQTRFGTMKSEAESAIDDEKAREMLLKSTTKELGKQEQAMRKLESVAKVLSFNLLKESPDITLRSVGKVMDFVFSNQKKVADDAFKRQRAVVDLATAQRSDLEQADVQRQIAVQSLIKSENERLDVIEMQIRRGEEAARVLELTQKDVDEATAKQIARREALLKPREQLQGVESRLLTRGPVGRDDLIKAIEKLPKSLGEEIAKQNHKEPPPQKLELEIVGM